MQKAKVKGKSAFKSRGKSKRAKQKAKQKAKQREQKAKQRANQNGSGFDWFFSGFPDGFSCGLSVVVLARHTDNLQKQFFSIFWSSSFLFLWKTYLWQWTLTIGVQFVRAYYVSCYQYLCDRSRLPIWNTCNDSRPTWLLLPLLLALVLLYMAEVSTKARQWCCFFWKQPIR